MKWLTLLRRRHCRDWDDRTTGRVGERLAARHMRTQGYRVIGRNVRLRVGEADIVCEAPDRRTIVIVEVKTRVRRTGLSAAGAAVGPEGNVGMHKQHKLRQVAESLARLNDWQNRPIRIDVIAVEFDADDPRSSPTLRHLEDAVRR